MQAATQHISFDGDVPATLKASQLREWGKSQLKEVGIENAALDARLLLQHVLGVSYETLLSDDIAVSDGAITLYDALLQRRIKREPVAKIIGRKAFWKQEFRVNAATLDPRPDSETLIEAVLHHLPEKTRPFRILDLGTGTGCLLLSLLEEYKQAQGLGVDISEQALGVARANASALNLDGRAVFRVSNWFEQVGGMFDVIVCNPPYIPEKDADALMPEVRKYDPFVALFAGVDGMEGYRTLLPHMVRHMEPDGLLVMELGAGQCEAVKLLAEKHGLQVVDTRADLSGIARALVCKPARAEI